VHALEDLEPLGIEFLEKVQESGFVSEGGLSVRERERARERVSERERLIF